MAKAAQGASGGFYCITYQFPVLEQGALGTVVSGLALWLQLAQAALNVVWVSSVQGFTATIPHCRTREQSVSGAGAGWG